VFARNWQRNYNAQAKKAYGSKVPKHRRLKVAEAASRINHRLWLGSFEVDFASGDLRCRASIDVEGGLVSDAMLSNMMFATLRLMEQYYVEFRRIAFSSMEPAVVLGEAA
jgi:hypothetical protein